MEIDNQQFEDFQRQMEEERSRIREIEQLHEEVFGLYTRGLLHNISPCWHLDVNEIDLSLQDHQYAGQLATETFTIINVNFENLLDHLPLNAQLIRRQQLYNEEWKGFNISRIISHWRRNEALIPPTIAISNAGYAQKVGLGGFPGNDEDLHAIDGKHRMNVAYNLNSQFIPIIIFDFQFERVSEILGL